MIILTTKMTQREFVKFQFALVYRKWWGILYTLIGFANLIIAIINYIHMQRDDMSMLLPLVVGIILLIVYPLFLWMGAVRQYTSNKLLGKEKVYEFENNIMRVKLEGNQGTVDLNTYYKIKEFKDLFLLYQSTRVAIYLPKKDMTSSQIEELRGIFKKLQGVKLQLKQ